jgi:hypothetical protein
MTSECPRELLNQHDGAASGRAPGSMFPTGPMFPPELPLLSGCSIKNIETLGPASYHCSILQRFQLGGRNRTLNRRRFARLPDSTLAVSVFALHDYILRKHNHVEDKGTNNACEQEHQPQLPARLVYPPGL